MNALLDTLQGWIGTLPIGGLYALLGTIAFIEGIFPPLPADVVVALGSFLAARRGASFPLTAASIVVGSVAGAMVVYSVARRYGAVWLHERLKRAGIDNLEQRLEVMYSKYGMTALFVSRFLPGLRAITPPMAGATRIPPVRTALVFLLASAVWYGAISWIAFTVGDDWEQMQRIVRQFARRVGVVAAIAAGLIAIIVMIVLRRRAADKVAAALVRADSQTK
ncbi:DedA family protein [bacterium]|nr:DedA family protein [bacterium]